MLAWEQKQKIWRSNIANVELYFYVLRVAMSAAQNKPERKSGPSLDRAIFVLMWIGRDEIVSEQASMGI